MGGNLWRNWDKPYEKAIVDEAHRLGKLVHNHNHGRCMAIVPDFVEIGFDCVCPFERSPGDVDGLEGLKKVRSLLQDRVTFNGNVHTVRALIRGTPEIVRQQVREIKEAFEGTPRVIIGTGDQVGGETPEENIYAMIEEGRKK
jgi:uroporphyrinogen-III decarboxylase